MRKAIRRLILLLLLLLAAWKWWIPQHTKDSILGEVERITHSFRRTADGTMKTVQEGISTMREHSESEDIANHPKVETDSTARDMRRQGKEDVNIQFYEEDTWYLNTEDLKDYYESAKRAVKDAVSDREQTRDED